ncbi:MAG: hypothetical protein ACI9EW_003546, partial [Cellvibrionaceae bacterium]
MLWSRWHVKNNNNGKGQRPNLTHPLFVIANLIFAIFIALVVSSADNLAVQGSGITIYTGSGDRLDQEFDKDGTPVEGGSSVVRIATNTPKPSLNSSQTPTTSQPTRQSVTSPEITVTPLSTIRCTAPPPSWFQYLVRPGDRLGDIAIRAGTT